MRGIRRLWFGTFVAASAALFLYGLIFVPSAQAAINAQINFQGKLTNPDGTNVANGNYSVRFRIYTDASADAANACLPGSNSCKWEETQGTVSVSSGIFNVALGSVTTLPGSVDFNVSGLYLGVKVGSDPEMTPRIPFTAAPYAFNSDKLGGIASTGYVQLGQGASAQVDASTNASIFVNKTGASGNILQLQKAGVDVFTIDNAGVIVSSAAIQGSTLNGTTGISTGAAGGTQRIDASGNLVNIGSITGTAAVTLQSGGTGALTLASAAQTGAGINSANVVISTGNASGTGSTAGNITVDAGTSATGNGSVLIATAARAQDVTVGNSTGGSIRIGQNGGTVQIDGTNFDVSTVGVVTLNGGQTADVTTAGSGTTANAMTMQPGSSGATTGTGAGFTLKAGDQTGTTVSTGGTLTLQGGSATAASGSRWGGNIVIDAGTGASGNGVVNIGATNASAITIGRAGIVASLPGTLAVGQAAARNGEQLDVNGTLRSNRYILGTGPDLSLIPIANNQSVLSSWWGLQLVGNRQAAVDYTPSNYGAAGAYGVLVPVQQAASVGFMVRAATAQTGDLAQFQDNGGNVQSAFSAGGSQLTLGNATVTGTSQGSVRFTDGTANGFYGTLQLSGTLSGNQTFTLPTGGGTFCTTGACVQLGQASAQTDSSTNAGVFINKTGASGNILQLQKTASDVFVVGNTGNITATGTYNSNTFNSSSLQFGATAAATVQSAASQALTITGHANSTWSTDAGTVTVQGFAGTTLASAARSTASTNSGAVTIASGNATGTTSTAGNVVIDVGTSTTGQGAIQIGTAARAQTISVGNSTAGTTLSLAAANGITLNNSMSVAAGQNITFAAGGAGSFNQSTSTGTFQTGTGAVSLNGATAVSTTTAGAVALTSTYAPGLSSGAVTMTATNGNMTFTTNVSITLNAGDFIVPTVTTGQARMIAVGGTGTSFTASQRFTGNVTGETFTIYRPVNILNSSANNVGLRINTAGSNTDAFQIYSAVTGNVTAAFDNAGDLWLGSSTASGSVSTPNVTGASTALFLTTGNSQSSGNTGAITLQSGNATSGTSGNITIDNGTSTTGSPQLNLGTANARTIAIGNTNATTVATISVGTSTSAFKLQGASSAVYMQLDTTNNRLYVGNPTADAAGFLLVLDSKNTTGDPTGVNGGEYYNSFNNKFRCYENNIWMDCSNGFNTVTKAADQAATQSSTTFQDDNTLRFTANANTTYVFDAWIPVNDSNATADLKYTFTTPTGSALTILTSYYSSSTAFVQCNIVTSGQTCANISVNRADHFIQVRGNVRVAGTAGTVQFRFAQNTSAAVSFPVIRKGATLSWHQSN